LKINPSDNGVPTFPVAKVWCDEKQRKWGEKDQRPTRWTTHM